MRLAFMGTPEFALTTLKALAASSHEISAVYSQAPSRAGRGKKLRLSPVHAFAEAAGIEVRTPHSMRKTAVIDEFCALELDACIVAAYGLILPKRVLAHPSHGCINVHASLLPRWRGAAPINRAIMAGDTKSGISIMEMEAGLDTGPVLLSEAVAIGSTTTASGLHDELADLGAGMLLRVLEDLENGELVAAPQPDEGATYADKIEKAEGIIDWSAKAESIDCLIRGLSPFPGAWFTIGENRFKALNSRAVASASHAAPGQLIDDQLTIACGEGAVQILELQRAGKGPMAAADFLRGFPLAAGTSAGLS